MPGPRRAPTLAALLGPGAAVVAVLGLTRTLGGTVVSRTLDTDPCVRVVGAMLVVLGWFILRGAHGVSIGLRRFVARSVAAGLVFAGVAQVAGPIVLTAMDPWLPLAFPLALPPGTRTLASAAVLCAATAYAWATSPLRR